MIVAACAGIGAARFFRKPSPEICRGFASKPVFGLFFLQLAASSFLF
jgi:hypothetical protein